MPGLVLVRLCSVVARVVGIGFAFSAGAWADATAPAVVVEHVTSEVVARTDAFAGRVRAIQSVRLVSRVEGILERLNFKEGYDVAASDELVAIQTAPYEAKLAAAEAQVAAAQAQVAAAQATLRNADLVLARRTTLARRDVVSQAALDLAQASRDIAAADVSLAQAAVGQARTRVRTAELNLGYTRIVAPISGRIGAAAVTQGNLVSARTGTIATIVQLDPIRVAFSIPEPLYTRLLKRSGSGTQNLELFRPELRLADGTAYSSRGKLAFASNAISPDTGTLTVYADFPNPDALLLPGGFVTVTVREANPVRMPVVPETAVLQDHGGRYVFVVGSGDRAVVRRIETGPPFGSGLPVVKGLADGDAVIVGGLQHVQPGRVVTIAPAAPVTTAAR